MDSIRQIAVQLPDGLQRLQLHLFANGLVGWSPQEEPASDGSHSSSSSEPGLRQPHDSPHASPSGPDQIEDGELSDDSDDNNDGDIYSEVDDLSGTGSPNQSSGMSDEEQIAEIHAFIVGDESEMADFVETALMAATQLVSSLADSSEYLEPEVIESLEELGVELHSIEGGLHLKIDEGHNTRSIYIYNDDVAASDTEEDEDNGNGDETTDDESDNDSDFSTAYSHEASSSRSSHGGRNSVTCPVCLQGYSSNARMAALSCRHHVCSCCYERLPRPKLCPICRGRIRSHTEVIL